MAEQKQATVVSEAGGHSLTEDAKVKEYDKKLFDLRKDGVNKIAQLREEIDSVKKNRMIDKDTKTKIIADDREKIQAARVVANQNKAEIATVLKEAVAYETETGKAHEAQVNQEQNAIIAELKTHHKDAVAALKLSNANAMAAVKAKYTGNLTPDQKAEMKVEVSNQKLAYKSALGDEQIKFNGDIQKAKNEKYDAYMERQNSVKSLRNGSSTILEKFEAYFKNYAYSWNTKNWLLANALYIVVILFFIACIIISPIQGHGSLLTWENILTILEQSSTRMFYALGVAGLILLAGTDLSVGRMVGMGAVVTSIILHNGTNIVVFFNWTNIDFSALGWGFRVVFALLASVFFCTLYSCVAGFFTAKFKMHPFISTLSTSLIMYGILYAGTQGIATGGVADAVRSTIGGRWGSGSTAFPKTIVYAIVAIIVAWFIWNKTKFGKNMFAVGGNSEAAAVSGINVFKVTMGVFIMAGIYYGCGSFLEAFKANASAGTGYGFELDAIAACVVGGISFNGGIGTIKGAVIGVLIFQGMTYCLSVLQIDTNWQFVLKGAIILAAVTLDCMKYIKKK
jgi:methyl-galactoside transport system permease protein